MDNKGWGLGEMLGLLAILLLGLVYSVTLINQNFGLKDISQVEVNEYYKQQEDSLKNAANQYSNDYLPLEEGNKSVVTLKSLQVLNYIKIIQSYNKEVECSGYVMISKNKGVISYNPYLNCTSYITPNYNKEFDDK